MASKRTKRIAIGLAILTALAGLWVVALTVGKGPGRFSRDWEEELLESGGPSKIAMIPISGEIASSIDPFSGGASASEAVSQLTQAARDPDVEAVILDLETPGGAVVASDVIYRKVLDVRRRGKPAVALMGDVAASGGYYVAAGAQEIVANPATLTGSIGVILVIPNLEKAADKLGIRPMVFKSGPHKDLASPFRTPTSEEEAILQGVIDEAYGQFVAAVASGRNLPEARVREIADGRIYTGNQARSLGLVDHLGGRDLALRRARELAKAPDASLVRYTRSPGLLGSLVGIPGASLSGLLPERARGLGIDLTPGLKYLWLP